MGGTQSTRWKAHDDTERTRKLYTHGAMAETKIQVPEVWGDSTEYRAIPATDYAITKKENVRFLKVIRKLFCCLKKIKSVIPKSRNIISIIWVKKKTTTFWFK